ncbi:MAG: AAA family ATPase [Magnetococcales bacterium]|nr:AAA family ATPase [Magnetococcales bacterium]
MAYSANRFLHKESGNAEEISNENHLLTEDVPLLNPETWLLDADYTASKDSPFQKQAQARLEKIRQTLIDLLPDVEDIRILPPSSARHRPKVEFKTPYGGVSFKDLSLGYRTMMGWVVDLADRMLKHYPESPEPLHEPAVVLVDEIDLHMHPVWQRKIMRHLSEHFPQTQFVATAHSPLIAQAAGENDTNIAVLRRVGDQVVIDNNPENIRNWRVDQILTSDLFGIPLRAEAAERLMAERRTLLARGQLTPEERERLQQVEAELGPLPVGESREERETMDILRAAADLLKQGR